MKIIYKYPLNDHGISRLVLPIGTKILSVRAQGSTIYGWVEMTPDLGNLETRKFDSKWMGELFPDGETYIATVQLGELVVHIYEITT